MKEKPKKDPMIDAVPFETNKFMEGKYIPDENMAFVDINRDPKLTKALHTFYYGTPPHFIKPNESGTIPIPYETYKKAAKEDLMTGPIPLHPKLLEEGTSYIYNLRHMTKDDQFILIRRTITCSIARPIVKELGNGYCEQTWLGDITKWPMYVEYDEGFK